MLDEGTPIFSQIADRLADEIADGDLAEGERVPSTNELAAYYRINPATAAKGINVLADDGLALIEHLGLGPGEYDLGGYSAGGRVVVRMLARGAEPGRAIVAARSPSQANTAPPSASGSITTRSPSASISAPAQPSHRTLM